MANTVSALVLRLDDPAEKAVSRLWEQLAAAGLPVRPRAAGAPPHVSLGAGSSLNIERLADALVGALDISLTLNFSSIAVFPTIEGVVFLAPVVSEELLAFHRRLYPLFLAVATAPQPYYAPGAWA